jgi:transducin (beta)-like 1
MLWNANTGELRQVFSDHQNRALCVDWLDGVTFAACSTDRKICIFQVGQPKAIQTLSGHANEVNKIEWDPSGTMLASCSDDKTVRVWRPFDRGHAIIFQGHTERVYTLAWSPGPSKLLASASFDCSVRIWDVPNKVILYVVTGHTDKLYTVSFSPKGRFFVTGGPDQAFLVRRTADGALVARYKCPGGIFEAIWNPSGNSIAACLSDATTAIVRTQDITAYDE